MAGPQNNAAQSFEAMIQADRVKKKHEVLAQQMLGSGSRRSSTTFTARGARGGGTLASRVGVTKRVASAPIRPSIDRAWTHDLHHDNEPRGNHRPSALARTSSNSRVERGHRIQAGLDRLPDGLASAPRAAAAAAPAAKGGLSQMSIRGMAATGPWCVVASNFAAGTTAADIEAAMAPIGGDIISCQIVNDHPNNVMAEIVFVDRPGAENVIATFNDQKADGKLLYVYMKAGPPKPLAQPRAAAPSPIVVESFTHPISPVKPSSPRAPTPGIPDQDMMEVEEAVRPAPTRERAREDARPRGPRDATAVPQNYQDRRSQQGRYQNGGGYSGGGGYGNGAYDSRDSERDYGRPRERDNGRGLYSDGMYRGGDRGYGRR